MEDILKQILEGQQQLFNEVSGLKDGQQQLFREVSGLKDGQQQLFREVSGLKDGQDKLIARMDALETKVDNMNVQQDENTQIIKAIRHNTEITNAEINSLKLTTLSKDALSHLATKKDTNKLNSKCEVLNSRLFHQEVELYELKAVK